MKTILVLLEKLYPIVSSKKLLSLTILASLNIGCITTNTVENSNTNLPVKNESNEEISKQPIKPPLGKRGVTAIYSKIARTYPGKIRLKKMFVSGLRSFNSYDDLLEVKSKKRKIEIIYNKKLVSSFDDRNWKSRFAIDQVYQILVEFQKHSEIIDNLSEQEIEISLLNGSLQSLSSGASIGDADNGENNIDLSTIGVGVVEFRNKVIVTDVTSEVVNIFPGDIVKAVNGRGVLQSTIGNSLNFKNTLDSRITLTIQSERDKKQREIVLSKDIQDIPPARFESIEDQVAYLHIKYFYNSLPLDVKYELEQMKSSINQRIKGLIIDLRGSAGGVVTDVIALADIFLSKGIISSVVTNKEKEKHAATSNATDIELPIVILVDAGTSSGAELFAAALKDNQRAVVIGSNTNGRGMIHTIFTVRDDRSLMTPSGYFYTPKGRAIQNAGIKPHVCTAGMKDNSSVKGYMSYFGKKTKYCDRTLHLFKNDSTDIELGVALKMLLNLEVSPI